jgi:small subunit ribosomal protein S4e
MGSKGNKGHLKRYNTPGYLQIHRKTHVFTVKPEAGPHSKRFCIPLGILLRDILKISNNFRESKFILNSSKILVDKKIESNHRYPVGLMDVIEIPDMNKAYRVFPSSKHGLVLSEITKDEAKFKLCRIEKITTLTGGHLQLNLHDGRNIKIKVDDPKTKPNIPYKTRGTLKISIPDQAILDYYPMDVQSYTIVFKGKNIGKMGKLASISKRFGVNASTAEIEQENGEKISTAYDFTFVLGKNSPSVDLPVENK